ncbi:group 3 secretory phospholipase A2-like [Thalassophryne amazonica]|uniref:group 3 secretory phospholipase A2-like n=1 Tax=Thalassophryne amazonica TaxID=390379 RepID=UPI0014714A47|nr:group 3 secretory phospholipase A2-like [Thalassophryne amazonica]
MTHQVCYEMKSMRLLQFIFTVSSLTLSNAQDVFLSGTSCFRSSETKEGQTHVMFLREELRGIHSLYLTLWSAEKQLVTCEVKSNPTVTESYYRTLCERSGSQGQEVTRSFNISMLLAPDGPCAPESSPVLKTISHLSSDGTERKTRTKRTIFPGTLWCGNGHRARTYEQLGMFENTDKCCREHDHCKHIISAFSVKYGVLNPNFFTISHCDCDERFRECLLGVNDAISNMVGYSFFNIIKAPCFELTQQKRCTQMDWQGMCQISKEAPHAIFKHLGAYHTPHTVSKYKDKKDSINSESNKDPRVTEAPTVSPTQSTKSPRRCSTRDGPRGDTFYPKKAKGKGCKTGRKAQKAPKPANTTTPELQPNTTLMHRMPTFSLEKNTSMLNTLKNLTPMSNKKRLEKKKDIRKGLSAHPTVKSQNQSQRFTKPFPQIAPTTQSITTSPQRSAGYRHRPTTSTAVPKTTKSHQTKAPKQNRCCEPAVRGNVFRRHCNSCLENTTTNTPPIATHSLHIKGTAAQSLSLSMTTERPKYKPLKKLSTPAASAMPVIAQRNTGLLMKAPATHLKDGKTTKETDSHLLQNPTSQEPKINHQSRARCSDSMKSRNQTHNAPRNMTGPANNHHLCGSLKYLDDCQYKIRPLEMKYKLKNMESKPVYHCDCTSRLAHQIESFERPGIVATLLKDFVSQYCFRLPEEKNCEDRKRCLGGIAKASDLLQALKKKEQKETTGAQNSTNRRKRGTPIRLYKRCLRFVAAGERC